MSALLLAASEPSKVPFFITGAVFVLWAIALASFGLTHPSFPFNARGQRAVMLVTVLLAGLAIAMAIVISK